MSSVTTNYGLYKANPVTDGADNFNIDTLLNENLDKIDEALFGKSENDHTHSAATTTTPGTMSAADKAKLDGVATGANVYTHPSTHGADMITETTTRKFVTPAEKSEWSGKATETTYSVTLTTSWSGSSAPFTQTISVPSILSTDTPVVDVVLSADTAASKLVIEAWGNVSRITTAANSITVYCYDEKPTVAIPIQLKVVR